MKNFLHHLNQALTSTYKTLWDLWLRPTFVILCFGVFLLAFSLIPVIYIENETFFSVWPFFGVVFSTFCLLSYLKYYDSRHTEPAEPEVLFQGEENGFSIIKESNVAKPLTLKESFYQGLWWTVYIFGVLFTALLIVLAWD